MYNHAHYKSVLFSLSPSYLIGVKEKKIPAIKEK